MPGPPAKRTAASTPGRTAAGRCRRRPASPDGRGPAAAASWLRRPRRPQPLHPDPRRSSAADLLVRDRPGRPARSAGSRPAAAAGSPHRLARSARASVSFAFAARLPRRHRLVEQRNDLVEHVDRRLRHQRQQDRVPALLAPLQRLRRQTGGRHRPGTGAARPAASTDPRCRRPVGAGRPASPAPPSPPRGLDASARPPTTPAAYSQPGIGHQQPVQIGAALPGQQVLHPRPTSRRAPVPGRSPSSPQDHHAGPDHPRPRSGTRTPAGTAASGESCSIARANRNSSSSFHSPVSSVPPPGEPQNLPQVVGAGLLPARRTRASHPSRSPGAQRQPAHRRCRHRRHFVRHEPQPRQGAQLHRRTQHVA